MRTVSAPKSFLEFRDTARALLQLEIEPDQIAWSSQESILTLVSDDGVRGNLSQQLCLSKSALRWMETLSLHADLNKWNLLYSLVWRLRVEKLELLKNLSDPQVARADKMVKQVRRDIHKMLAFIRFKRVESDQGERFIAWYKPDHAIVSTVASLLKKRYGQRCWSVITPHECIHWDCKKLKSSPGIDLSDNIRVRNDLAGWWKNYHAAAVNSGAPKPVNERVRTERHQIEKQSSHLIAQVQLMPGLFDQALHSRREM